MFIPFLLSSRPFDPSPKAVRSGFGDGELAPLGPASRRNSICGREEGLGSSRERERYARPRGPRKFALANFWGELASRVGAERVDPSPSFVHVGIMSSPAHTPGGHTRARW